MSTRTVVIGEGSWGTRVKGKIEGFGAPVVSVEPLTAGREEFDRLAGFLPTHVVIAVPPSAQAGEALHAMSRFESLTDLRLEKPGCMDEDELLDVLAEGQAKDVQVSIGYTLAANPAHAAVQAMHVVDPVQSITATRASLGVPNHDVTAMLDLGSHAAYLAAALGVEDVEIVAAHNTVEDIRLTEYQFEKYRVIVNEVAGLMVCPEMDTVQPLQPFDALAYELGRFLLGDPVVPGAVGIDAHRILAQQWASV